LIELLSDEKYISRAFALRAREKEFPGCVTIQRQGAYLARNRLVR
jgi:hypothetical protein